MGLFSRLGQMFRGFFGLFVGNLEERNPDALFEDIKNQIDKARRQAEQQIIEIQTSAEMIKIEMKTAEKNLNAIKARVESAQRVGDKELLVELLVQEEEYQTVYETHKATYENAMTQVQKIREDYKIFESEMNAKLNELKTLKSQAKMANLRENINSVNAQYTSKNSRVGSVNDSLDRARDIVNKKTARANAVESLNQDNIDMKLKKLDMNSARDRAKARAEALLGGDNGGFEVKEKTDNKMSN
ncbi:PspA/IM30 family protein [Ruminiclostridium papyrosolvens DSM 2782]|uniref:PspA/IM30 family protein n=1 Tax=Ruminiclostridium papyrosolvens DSM 2782 TaxID=588581 RepID=F1TCI6_9FIRM|nr:PspA/IM30 family protein [Ruminiclostridium papyrosolvens]EGD47703.1 PspA/IM30 family protein [Ruminiclostridium papyrosolvens DSM 2782]WES34421.1 PspA/IM30 family protein [Ruminiclostridium papyrosolvens DSM 2782]